MKCRKRKRILENPWGALLWLLLGPLPLLLVLALAQSRPAQRPPGLLGAESGGSLVPLLLSAPNPYGQQPDASRAPAASPSEPIDPSGNPGKH